jgi:hypothetical protein
VDKYPACFKRAARPGMDAKMNDTKRRNRSEFTHAACQLTFCLLLALIFN